MQVPAGTRWFRARYTPEGRVGSLHLAERDLEAVCGYRISAEMRFWDRFDRLGADAAGRVLHMSPEDACKRCLARAGLA